MGVVQKPLVMSRGSASTLRPEGTRGSIVPGTWKHRVMERRLLERNRVLPPSPLPTTRFKEHHQLEANLKGRSQWNHILTTLYLLSHLVSHQLKPTGSQWDTGTHGLSLHRLNSHREEQGREVWRVDLERQMKDTQHSVTGPQGSIIREQFSGNFFPYRSVSFEHQSTWRTKSSLGIAPQSTCCCYEDKLEFCESRDFVYFVYWLRPRTVPGT